MPAIPKPAARYSLAIGSGRKSSLRHRLISNEPIETVEPVDRSTLLLVENANKCSKVFSAKFIASFQWQSGQQWTKRTIELTIQQFWYFLILVVYCLMWKEVSIGIKRYIYLRKSRYCCKKFWLSIENDSKYCKRRGVQLHWLLISGINNFSMIAIRQMEANIICLLNSSR